MKTPTLLSLSFLGWIAFVLPNFSALAQDNSSPLVFIWTIVPETLEPSGNTDVTPGVFEITRLGNTNEELVLYVEITGTATSGQDYQELSHYLVMPAGVTKLPFLVVPLEDAAVEGNETVTVTLAAHSPTNSTPNYGVHFRLNHATVVIHDNDFPNDRPVVSVSAPSAVLESCPPNADCVGLEFRLRRTGPGRDQPLTAFLLYGGTATADVDYWALPRQVTFEAGSEFATVSSTPIDDTLFEGDETIVTTIGEGFGYYIDPNRRQATTVLRDDDPLQPPIVSLAVVERDAGETLIFQASVLWGEFNVSRTGPATNELVVYLDPQQGSARLGEDFWIDGVENGSTFRFRTGVHSVNIRLYPIDDEFYEGTETVRLRLVAPPPASDPYEIDLVHSSVDILIHDNDPANPRPQIAILQPGAGAEFPFDSAIEIRAEARDSDGFVRKAEFFADDRKIGEQNIAFLPPPPGQTQTFHFVWRFPTPGTHTLTVHATDDDDGIRLSAPIDIRVMLPDALPVVAVAARDAFAVEPGTNAVLNLASFRIRRFGPTNEPLVVNYSWHGTARNGMDYEMVSEQAILPAGQRTVLVTVRPVPNALAEGTETVILRLEEPPPIGQAPEVPLTGYRVGLSSQAVVLISDDPWVHPPQGARCVPLPDGLPHICFGAQTGYNFRLEASADLRNWETICSTLATDGAVHFVDGDAATFPNRFYRIAPEPVADADD